MKGKGRIVNFIGTWGSGVATLVLRDQKGKEVKMAVENAPTVRALDSAFGGVIGEGHTVNLDAIKGKWIEYEYDQYGAVKYMTSFNPVGKFQDRLEEVY